MYRRVLLSAVTSVALVSSAFAADIYMPSAPYYASVALPPSWAGFYLGVNGGYGGETGLGFRDEVIYTPIPTPYAVVDGKSIITGGFGGGQLGYNFQFGSFVLGAETDLQGSNIMGSGAQTYFAAPASTANFCGLGTSTNPTAYPCGARNDLDVNWFGTVRAKLGYAFGGTLLYVTGGLAYGGVTESSTYTDYLAARAPSGPVVTGRVSSSTTQTGWTAGAGIETKITPNWSLKGEYQFVDLGSVSAGPMPLVYDTTPLTSYPHTASSQVEFNTVRVGLNYYFNAPPPPLPIK